MASATYIAVGGTLFKSLHSTQARYYVYIHFFTRYPRPKSRMWFLLSLFDPQAYANFFTVIILTFLLLKIFAYLGLKLGLNNASEDVFLFPARLKLVDVGHSPRLCAPGFSFKFFFICFCLFGGILL